MADKQLTGQAAAGRGMEPWIHIGLALVKGAGGLVFGSSALLSDAFRSALDGSRGFSLPVSEQKKASKQSNRRAADSREYGISYIVSVLLMLIGLEVAVLAVRHMMGPLTSYPDWQAAFIIPICLGLRLLLIRGPIPGWEWAPSLVAAAGSAGAWAGGASDTMWLIYLDPAASVLIGAFILRRGYQLMLEMGKKQDSPPENHSGLSNELVEVIQRISGVITVESVRPLATAELLTADIIISVNPRISVLEGSDIARRVKELVLRRFAAISEVRIYVEPYNPGYPYKSNHDPNQEHMPTLLQ